MSRSRGWRGAAATGVVEAERVVVVSAVRKGEGDGGEGGGGCVGRMLACETAGSTWPLAKIACFIFVQYGHFL